MTNSGIRDLMHHVTEDVEEWLEAPEHDRGDVPAFLRRILEPQPRAVHTITDVNPSLAFHCDTFAIPAAPAGQTGGSTLLSARTDRARAVITNIGLNPAFLSFSDDVSNFNSAGEMAWVQLPASPQGTAGSGTISAGGAGSAGLPAGSTLEEIVLTFATATTAAGTATITNTPFGPLVFNIPSGTTYLAIPGTYAANIPGNAVTVTVAGAASVGGGSIVLSGITGYGTVNGTPGNAREIRAGGKLYAYSPLGTQLDILEEYGYRNREGGMLSP